MEEQQVDFNKLLDISSIPGFEGGTDVSPIYEPLELKKVDSNPEERSSDLNKDYSIVRENMHYQSQMLMDAAKIFLESAKNSDSPRHMEVFAALMGQMTTTNKELLKVHKDMKDITGEDNTKKPMMFMSSPSDRMKRLGSSYDALYSKEDEEEITDV